MAIGEGAFPSSFPRFYPLPTSLPSLPSTELPPLKRGTTTNARDQSAEQSLGTFHQQAVKGEHYMRFIDHFLDPRGDPI